MTEENISQEFRLKNIDETRNYFIEKTNQNKLVREKVCGISNYSEHLLILASTLLDVFQIFAFAFLLEILVGITSSAVVLENFSVTVEIKKV